MGEYDYVILFYVAIWVSSSIISTTILSNTTIRELGILVLETMSDILPIMIILALFLFLFGCWTHIVNLINTKKTQETKYVPFYF